MGVTQTQQVNIWSNLTPARFETLFFLPNLGFLINLYKCFTLVFIYWTFSTKCNMKKRLCLAKLVFFPIVAHSMLCRTLFCPLDSSLPKMIHYTTILTFCFFNCCILVFSSLTININHWYFTWIYEAKHPSQDVNK